jgi:hypothetical protein
MKTILRSWPLLLLGVFALAAVAFTPLTGCVASAGVYAGDYEGEYYYDAPGYVVYDGWGPTYHVGPPREDHDHPGGNHDDHHDTHGAGGNPGHPAYRPAPSSRAVPSIPTQSHPPSRAPGKNRE